jgi:hypothetical protein
MRLLQIFVLACALAGPATAQLTDARRAAVARLQEVIDAAPDAPQAQIAVDRYLQALPLQERFQLESDTFLTWRLQKRLTNGEYIGHMLGLIERYTPLDADAIDFWRYAKMLDAKVERGLIIPEEADYLLKKREAELAAKEADQAERQRANAAMLEAQAEQQRRAAIGNALRGIGDAFRPKPQTCSIISGRTYCF